MADALHAFEMTLVLRVDYGFKEICITAWAADVLWWAASDSVNQERVLGTVFGAATMASCLGMAIGPAIGGWIFDRFGSYAGMYFGSLAIGLGAVAIAFIFPALPRLRLKSLKMA
jgi:MFS family permease